LFFDIFDIGVVGVGSKKAVLGQVKIINLPRHGEIMTKIFVDNFFDPEPPIGGGFGGGSTNICGLEILK
jgi:hypothetical protein